jgi:hypothetical protein
MAKERDKSSGRYVEKATLDDVLAVFDAVDGPPVVTSADVADATNLSRDSARRKLKTLRDQGRVDKRKTAGRVLYWPADASESREPAENRIQDDAVDTTPKSNEQRTGTVARRNEAEARAGERESDQGPVDTDELPVTVDVDDAAAAIGAARDYIRDHGGATKADLVRHVMPDHPLGYDVDGALEKIDGPDRYRGAWWRRVVKPGLEADDDVEKPPRGGSVWEYDGDDTDT